MSDIQNEEKELNQETPETSDHLEETVENEEVTSEEIGTDAQTEIIEKLTAELQSSKDALLRKVAEFENLKRRTQKERLAYFTDAKIEALEKFLPVRDDLQRSLDAADPQKVDKGFLEGINMVAEKFERILSEYGVEAIEEENVPFNVDIHDALLRQPAPDDSVPSDTVLKVLETGYKIGDKVIKHAKVIVSQ